MKEGRGERRPATADRGPIFIGGLDRSGKTYMRLMLTSHPHIAMSRRTNLWTHFYNRFGDLSRQDNFERCLAAMLRRKHVRSLQPDPERLRREFWQGEPTYVRLFALLHQQYAEREGKPRWGAQTELVERYADLVFSAYPTARMIHMLRDPRDRYEASLARRPQGRGRVGAAAARWQHSAGLARRNRQRYPDRYKIIRYETMVSQPEETLQEVCAFLEEEYTAAMLTMEEAARFQEGSGQGANPRSGQSPLSTDYVGRYRQVVPMREIAFMQAYAGREMEAWGYPLEPIRFSLGDRLRFYFIDWPGNLARMAAWRALEARRPAQA